MSQASNNQFDAMLSLIYLRTGVVDPSVVAVDSAKGTLYLQVGGVSAPQAFLKQDDGLTTNWLIIDTGIPMPTIPGGVDTNVQFNDGGSFGGNNDLVYIKATPALILKAIEGIQMGTSDAFARKQIWNNMLSSVFREGSWQADGDATSKTSEGIVVYGNSLSGNPISPSDGSYARIKNNRFGLFTIDSSLPAYGGPGAYYFRVDDVQMFMRDDLAAITFKVDRVTGDITTARSLISQGSISGTFTQKAANTTTSYIIKWPAAQGVASTLLSNDGAGNLSWVASVSPGGVDTNVQFNDGGVFGGTAGFTFDKTNVRVGINQATPKARIHANSNTTSGIVGTDAMILGNPHATENIGAGAFIANGSISPNAAAAQDSHVEGSQNSIASTCTSAHAEGLNNTVTSTAANAHVEGRNNNASKVNAHCEGLNCVASGNQAHSEGEACTASGTDSHAEGNSTVSSNNASHSEGNSTTASGLSSHSEGKDSVASGTQSHAGGQGSLAQAFNQTAIGRFNVGQGTAASFVAGDDAFIIGNGTSGASRANAFSISNDGKVRTQREIYQPDTLQTLGAAFTITPNKTYTKIDSAGAVTSSAVTAITAGSEEGQQLILDNRGAFNIILKNGAVTELPGGIDYTIGPKGTISFVWTGSNWRCTGASSN